MPLLALKQQLAEKVANFLKLPDVTSTTLESDITYPPSLDMGHLALPCFRFAKSLKKGADKIAADLASQSLLPGVSSSASGPYVNFRLDPLLLFNETTQKIALEKGSYGSDKRGTGKTVVLEHCSPNIAKRLGFQHIRSTLIGNTLSNVYAFLGYKIERMNFVGDWGTQFARLLAAVELWGQKETLSTQDVKASMKVLLDLYVRFHKDVDDHEEYLTLANKKLKALEENDPKAVALWKSIRDISVASMDSTLKRMHVAFDWIEGESTYIPAMEATLNEIKTKAGARLSEGAWIVEVEGLTTPALIQKRDGTTLYLTRDTAAAIDRYQRFKFDEMLYMVSEQQKLHFQLLFGVLKKMGNAWADRCRHVSFGTVLFGSEKMSTREGRVIFLDDILDEGHRLALKECTEKNPELKDKEAVAESVGIGAICFGVFSTHRSRDIEFDWKRILAFDGETGPYVQYAAVRCSSLLEKAKEKKLDGNKDAIVSYTFLPEEEALTLTLARFRAALEQVIRENEPFYLARYLIDVAKSFNRFYYNLPVLQAAQIQQLQVRLELVRASQQVLLNGLRLLGIDCPREM